jgi:hypothetical protein
LIAKHNLWATTADASRYSQVDKATKGIGADIERGIAIDNLYIDITVINFKDAVHFAKTVYQLFQWQSVSI